MIADRPRACCGCPEPISIRLYEEDPCWLAAEEPREIPQSCYPEYGCDAICEPCPEPGEGRCVDGQCQVQW